MAANDTTKTAVPQATTTPSSVKAGIGALEFTDGYPTGETAARLRDHLDYLHGVDAFMNSIQGVSTYAIRQGFQDTGVMDNDVLIFSELMDSKSLFLTGNADTVYFWSFLDLSDGPLVLETPSETLGMIDDMWFRWITDFGLPGPDRGQGGRYLVVSPGYDGPLPEGGYYVGHSRTNHALVVGRAFINENPGMDPAPTVARIKEQLKIYAYAPGGEGSSIGAYLQGEGPLGKVMGAKTPRFVEGSGPAGPGAQRAASGSRRPGLLQGDQPVQVLRPRRPTRPRRRGLGRRPSPAAEDLTQPRCDRRGGRGAGDCDGQVGGTAPSTRWSSPGRHGRVGSLP